MEKQRWEESDGRAEVGRVREEKVREEKRRDETRREEKRRREKIREEKEKRKSQKKESEERRCRCTKRKKGRDFLCFSGDLWLRKVEKKAGAEPFGQMSCQKSAPRCGTKHISKSK